MAKIVRDKQGKPYRIGHAKSDGAIQFYLEDAGGKKGYCYVVPESKSSWQLADIEICNVVEIRQSKLVRRIRTSLRLETEPQSYRGLGLGSALLDSVIASARESGVRHIRSSIAPDDIQTTPYLLEWYQKHGFQQVAPQSGHSGGAVAVVQIDL